MPSRSGKGRHGPFIHTTGFARAKARLACNFDRLILQKRRAGFGWGDP
jgi:hypothetical protein